MRVNDKYNMLFTNCQTIQFGVACLQNYKTIPVGVAFSVQGTGSKQTVNNCMGKKIMEVLVPSLHNSNNSDLLVTMYQAKGIP